MYCIVLYCIVLYCIGGSDNIPWLLGVCGNSNRKIKGDVFKNSVERMLEEDVVLGERVC